MTFHSRGIRFANCLKLPPHVTLNKLFKNYEHMLRLQLRCACNFEPYSGLKYTITQKVRQRNFGSAPLKRVIFMPNSKKKLKNTGPVFESKSRTKCVKECHCLTKFNSFFFFEIELKRHQ